MRWLILGGGAIVWQSHLPALVILGWDAGSAVVEPLERNLERLRAVGSRADLIVGSYRDVLSEAGLKDRYDAVLIALPNSMHADAVERCMDAGLPCLCEKPLGLDSAESRRLGQRAADAGVPLGVAMVRRYVPSLQTAKTALEQGLIGRLQSVEVSHGAKFAWPADSGYYFRRENGGILLNMGVHHLDFLESVLGPLTPVAFEDDGAGGVEANCVALLQSGAGVEVRLSLSFTHRLQNEYVWRGERGELRHSVDEFGTCRWAPTDGRLAGELQLVHPYQSGDWKASFSSGFVEQFDAFARAVRERTAVPVPPEVAVQTAGLIEACHGRRVESPSWMPDASSGGPGLSSGAVLVTGASGFVGNRLAERLQRLGVGPVVTPVRSRQTVAGLARLDVDIQQADITDLATMRSLLKGRRHVFHLAYGASGADAARFTIDSTRVIVDAAIAEGCETLVVVSTGSVFGTPAGRVTEDSPYLPSLGDYGSSKAEAERYALAAAARSGSTRIVVINPSAVYGPTGPTFTEVPVRLASQGQFFWVEEGRGHANYVYVENLVDALLLAAATSAAHGRRYLISDGVTTWRKFLEPMMGSHAAGVPSYSLTELARGSQHSPDLGEILKLATVRNPAFMAAVSKHPWLGRLKQQVVALLPGWQQRVQAERAPDWRSDFLKPNAAGTVRNLWLADLFGPIQTEYVADRARRELGWSPRFPLAEGQRISRAWLNYLGL